MKKAISIIIIIMMMVIFTVPALGEPVKNINDAYDMLYKYAAEKHLDLWANSHYDQETRTQYDLLTLNKQLLKEDYNCEFNPYDFDEFIQMYKNQYFEQMGINVNIKMYVIDQYEENNIYELIITSTDDIAHPNYGKEINTASVIFIIY